jgi:hypothetical protein
MNRHPATARALRRVVRVWHDMDHAQKRMFELRTGVRVIEPRR